MPAARRSLPSAGKIGASVSATLRDGALRIDATGDLVRPGMTGADFMELQFVRDAGYREGTYTGAARLGVQRVYGLAFHISFHFEKSRLRSVHLCHEFEDSAEREPWAYDVEIERKQRHEEWCERQIGEPLSPLPGYEGRPKPEENMQLKTYPWGAVRSIYDGKAGCSFVSVEYA